MAANNRVDLSSFPKLKLNAQDVTTSWKHWLSQFEIAVELTTLNLGTVDDGHGHLIDVFRGRTKLLALLSSIGSEGMETLQSLGFDLQNNDINAYTVALDLLKGHYEREESRYVKTIKYVTVAQAIGEEERDYLLRVEKLSRTMEFGHANEQIRERFNVALAVNGLSDRHMRRMLLQENELTWANLTTKLRAKSLARESEEIITGARAGQFNVKQEPEAHQVSVVTRGKSGYHSDRDTKKFHHTDYSSNNSDRYLRRYSNSSSDEGDYCNNRRSYNSSRYFDEQCSQHRLSNSRNSIREGDNLCYNCGAPWHKVRYCPLARCFTCDDIGHTSLDCSEKGKDHRYSSHRDYGGKERHKNRSGKNRSSNEERNSYRFDSGSEDEQSPHVGTKKVTFSFD